jgi:hypothetical protein
LLLRFFKAQIYLIFVTDSQSKSAPRTELHDFANNRATKGMYKSGSFGGSREMTKQVTEKTLAGQQATQAATQPAKRRRPLAGFFIAGASLALLFGIAALKGRVKDDNIDSERGLE